MSLRHRFLTYKDIYIHINCELNGGSSPKPCFESINTKYFLKFTELKGEEVEIFIRTGGEKRVSNFLLPTIGYSELFFSDKLWPDFNAEDFNADLDDFKTRQRRFGK